MVRGIQSPAYSGDVAGYSRSGFVVAGQDALDLVALVGPENFLITAQRHAFAPFNFNDVHVEA